MRFLLKIYLTIISKKYIVCFEAISYEQPFIQSGGDTKDL